MFAVDSFIKKPGVGIEREELKNHGHKYFVNISNCVELKKIEKSLDWDYLDGAIRLSYFDNVVIGFEYWDLVDQCWLFLCDMVDELNVVSESQRYFPDMPVQMKMSKVNTDYIKFTLDTKEWLLPCVEFSEAIYQGAIAFYTNLIDCFVTDHPQFQWWNTELEKIKKKPKLL